MVTFGCDSHKRTHTLVVVDQNGCQLAESGNGRWRTADICRGCWNVSY